MPDQSALRIPRGYGVGWIGEAWNIFRLSPWLWVLAGLGTYLTMLVVSEAAQLAYTAPLAALMEMAKGQMPASLPALDWRQYTLIAIATLAQFLVHSFILSGQLRLGLRAMRREPVRIADAFTAWERALPMFGYYTLLTLTMIICLAPALTAILNAKSLSDLTLMWFYVSATVILFLAGLLVYTLALPGMALVADGVGPWTAFKRSVRASTRHFSAVMGLFTVLSLLWIGAACTLGIGWLVLYPMGWILYALMARDIAGIPGQADPAPGEMNFSSYATAKEDGAWPPPPADSGSNRGG